MRLDYLRYFDRLAEVMNYTRAAEELYIAQPTLSVAIKRMETELGIKLFQRGEGNARIELTQAGEAFHEYVALALKTYDAGLRIAREVQGEVNSSMRIGTLYAMQGRFWSQAMQAFEATRPAPPQFTIEQAYSAELVDRVRRNDLDVAFAARVPNSDDLSRVLVWSQPLVLAVNKSHPLSHKKAIGIDELKGHELLTYSESSPVTDALNEKLPCDELDVRREYDDEITLCAMVSSNPQKMALLCYSFLVEAFGDVACVHLKGLPSDFHKVYLFSRRETHPKVVADFIDFMTSYRFPNALDLAKETRG